LVVLGDVAKGVLAVFVAKALVGSPSAEILATLQETVFTWPDETELYPGHGVATTVGQERPAFEAFLQKPRSDRLCGDVTWE